MAAKAFDALETVLKVGRNRRQDRSYSAYDLKRLQSLAARKWCIGLKQTVLEQFVKKA